MRKRARGYDADAAPAWRPRRWEPSSPPERPLAIVTALCGRQHPRVAAIPSIAIAIDAFVGVAAHWTVASAYAELTPDGTLATVAARQWLVRVASQEPRDMEPLYRRKIFADAMVLAARRGDLRVVQWLMEQYLPTGRVRQAVEAAAKGGQLEVLKWLRENHNDRVVWGRREMEEAATGNHLETLKWLFVQDALPFVGRSAANDIMIDATKHGNIAMMQWLWPSMFDEMDRVQVHVAALHGRLAFVKWMSLCFQAPIGEQSMSAAVAAGHLKLARWMWRKRKVKSTSLDGFISAAQGGHLDVLKFIKKKLKITGKGRRHVAMDLAAGNGHFEVVRYLQDHFGARCSTNAMDNAARCGHFEIVKWLHTHRTEGCTKRAMDGAAANGHLEVVKWLHLNRSEGCTIDAMDWAAESNHLAVVEWLHENRMEGCTLMAMDRAALFGHLEMVQWLDKNRDEGCSFAAMDNAAGNGHLDVVKWFCANRTEECSEEAMTRAAENGDLPMLKWLLANLHDHLPRDILGAAVSGGHTHVVAWLLDSDIDYFLFAKLDRAVISGHFDLALLLRRAGCALVNRNLIEFVQMTGQYELLQWLLREFGANRPEIVTNMLRRDHDVYLHDCLEEPYPHNTE